MFNWKKDKTMEAALTAQPVVSSEAPSLSTKNSLLAAWVIGPYLVAEVLVLVYLGMLAAYAPDGSTLAKWLPALPTSLSSLVAGLADTRFSSFQRNAIATCSAGLGGAVYMLREFYINFSYGCEYNGQKRRYLQAREIPRYVLLPFSSCILGPIGLALLKAGELAFSGYAANSNVPIFTTVAVCFLLGFSYHDTLGKFSELSRKFWKSREQSKEDQKLANTKDALKSQGADVKR